jgi:allophanate hydrolase subunit 2
MGYRLQGRKISANIQGVLSEGICHGAVQIPPDGQPIVLLNDRQTIGGYPKIGAVIAIDTAKLAQLGCGGKVRFESISIEEAHNLFHLSLGLFTRTPLIICD